MTRGLDIALPAAIDSASTMLRIRYFTDEQVRLIHENALGLLERQGFRVDHRRALAILADRGAAVDFEAGLVKVKPDLVAACLASAPKEVVLGARDPAKDLRVLCDPPVPLTRNGGGVDKIIDLGSGRLRDMSLEDTRGLYRALEAMDGISMVSPLYPQDVPESIRDLKTLETLLANTAKHVNIRTFSRRNLDGLVAMGEIAAGGREAFRRKPVFSLFDSPLSPLKFPELVVDVFLTAGEHGIPVFLANLPIAGVSGPLPLAGMVQLLHAELLAGVTICQSAHPGAPLILHPLAMTMDMRSGLALSASIESTMITAGITQVANAVFGLPVDAHGPWSDTFLADSQSAMERTFQTLFPALSGAAIIAGFGDVQQGLAFCPVQLGLDEELIGLAQSALKGIPFDEERLSVAAIERAGFGGDFMTDITTRKFFRTDYHWPTISNRLFREEWERRGAKDMNARARERIEKLMAVPPARPLEESRARELGRVVDAYR
ncbi:MAG: hypothetical protein FJY82_05215 [Candidatus Aminicenantes bacterium]|nr:hypothetical protein [Candidatus Aminicenantes bacterium]